MIQKFFIKQHSSYPALKFPLTQRIMEKYDISENILENCAITFSMIDENGNYIIANYGADLKISEERYLEPDEVKFSLIYNFTKFDTEISGNYRGEFKIDFLGDNCGCITFPTEDYIDVRILGSNVKTTVY